MFSSHDNSDIENSTSNISQSLGNCESTAPSVTNTSAHKMLSMDAKSAFSLACTANMNGYESVSFKALFSAQDAAWN